MLLSLYGSSEKGGLPSQALSRQLPQRGSLKKNIDL